MRSRITFLSGYAIAMGYLEAVVVIYLRRMYYPQGFEFPLVIPDDVLMRVEVAREAATLAMILSVAMLAGKKAWDRFAAFMFVFGVWDIVYYVGLWATIGWPSSLGAWDVLFLIPVPWIAPVWAPVLIALLLISAAAAIWRLTALGRSPAVGRRAWAALVGSGVLVLTSFMLSSPDATLGHPPKGFAWPPYWIGVAAALVVAARSYSSSRGEGA